MGGSVAVRRTDTRQAPTVAQRRNSIRDLVKRYEPQLAAALPACGLTPGRLLRVVYTALSKNPDLYECTETSLIGAVMTAAQLGLMPDGTLGMAYLIPYYNGRTRKKEAQFQAGYRGLMQLARRSGQIATIEAVVVRRSDAFEFARGTESFIRHTPNMQAVEQVPEGDDAGLWKLHHGEPIVAVYAVAKLTNGETQFEVMPTHEVERLRFDSSKAAERGPWVTHWPAMARKTAVKRLLPYLPVSTDAHRAVNLDDLGSSGVAQNLEAESGLIDLGVAVEAPPEQPEKPTPPEQPSDAGSWNLEPCGVCQRPTTPDRLADELDMRVCDECRADADAGPRDDGSTPDGPAEAPGLFDLE